MSLRFGFFFHITLLWLQLQLIFPSQVCFAMSSMSSSWPSALSLYFLSSVQLRRRVIEWLWCPPGDEPGSTLHSWPEPYGLPAHELFTEQISPQLDPASLPASRGWTRWPLDVTSNQIYSTSKALWVGLKELEEQEEKHNGGNRF